MQPFTVASDRTNIPQGYGPYCRGLDNYNPASAMSNNEICVMVGQRRHVFCRGFSGPSSGNWGGEWLCRWGALGHLCLPFGCGVYVRDTACVPGHCELNRFGGDLYSMQRSQCHGHHSSSIDAEFFFTSLKTRFLKLARIVRQVPKQGDCGLHYFLNL